MMRFLFFNNNGDPSYTLVPSDPEHLESTPTVDGKFLEVPSEYTNKSDDWLLQHLYLSSSEGVVKRPEKPSIFHYWDHDLFCWQPNLPASITYRGREVDAERDRRLNLPFIYDNKRLDADARARENLKSKLEEIKAREALLQPMPTEMLVWRDADNITHTWATQEAYKAWLEGFTIAMSERGTRLYAAAWQHKANIAALTDVDAIVGYDVTSNWPV